MKLLPMSCEIVSLIPLADHTNNHRKWRMVFDSKHIQQNVFSTLRSYRGKVQAGVSTEVDGRDEVSSHDEQTEHHVVVIISS